MRSSSAGCRARVEDHPDDESFAKSVAASAGSWVDPGAGLHLGMPTTEPDRPSSNDEIGSVVRAPVPDCGRYSIR